MDKSQMDMTEEYTSEIVTLASVFSELYDRILVKQYQILAEPGGEFSGFNIYRVGQLDLKGLNAGNWVYQQKLTPDHFAYTAAQRQISKTLRDIIEDDETDTKMSFCLELLKGFTVNTKDTRNNKVYSLSLSLINTRPKLKTLSGESHCHQWIPQKEWFSFQDTVADDCLALFPPAERKFFMALIGRVLAGSDGSQSVEGIIKHTWRSYALVLGLEAGQGKSTLIEYITDALQLMGYSYADMPLGESRFGWRRVAQADLAFVDDLDSKSQNYLMKSAHLKSIAASKTLRVEDKGVDAVSVKANCAVVMMTNQVDPTTIFKLDAGSLDRLHVLQLYTNSDLKRVHPDKDFRSLLVPPTWLRLAEKYNVDHQVVTLKLLQECFEYFLEVSQITIESGVIKQSPETLLDNPLMHFCQDIRKDYQFKADKHAELMADSISRVIALAALCSNKPEQLDRLKNGINLNAMLLIRSLYVLSDVGKDLGISSDFLDGFSKTQVRAKADSFERMIAAKPNNEVFRAFMAELQSPGGFGFPAHAGFYSFHINNNLRNIEELMSEYQNVPERLSESALEKLDKIYETAKKS